MGRPNPARLFAEPAPCPAPGPADPEPLIQRLIRWTETAPPGPGRSGVVLDMQVGPYRCVLIRQPASGDDAVELSPREQEIARMVAKGLPNKVIARVLDISTWTVGTYLRRIFAKLGVSSRAAMVAQLAGLRPQAGEARPVNSR